METHKVYINSKRRASINFEMTASRLKSSVASCVWAVEEGDSVSLDGEVLASNVAQIEVTASQRSGVNLIRCIATLDNGEVIPEYFKVNVIDPGV